MWRGSLLPLRAELVVLARANGPSGGVVETVVIVHKKGGWWHCFICRCETLLSSGRVRGLHEGEKRWARVASGGALECSTCRGPWLLRLALVSDSAVASVMSVHNKGEGGTASYPGASRRCDLRTGSVTGGSSQGGTTRRWCCREGQARGHPC